MQWVDMLPWAEYHYNTAAHSGIGTSPFHAVYGREPPALLDYIPGSSKVAAVDDILTQRTGLLQHLHDNLARAQNRMVQKANKHRTDMEFSVGDWVYVRLQPYRQTTLGSHKVGKLAKRYYGPFEVIERIGLVAYKLALPEGSRVHNVFHISVLKKCRAEPPFANVEWPEIFVDTSPQLEPEEILRFRVVQRGDAEVEQIKVKWKAQGYEDATWEDVKPFKEEYPHFNLEDKVFGIGGSNDASGSREVRRGNRIRKES